jgi:hypothetical protein
VRSASLTARSRLKCNGGGTRFIASSIGSPLSIAKFILCKLATCLIAAETIAAGDEPLARALPNSLSTSEILPANAASTTSSSAICDASATIAITSASSMFFPPWAYTVSFRISLRDARRSLPSNARSVARASGEIVRPASRISSSINCDRLRRGSDHGFDRRRDIACSSFHEDGTAASEKWNGVGFLYQSCRISCQLIPFDTGKRERVIRIVDRCTH